MTGFKGRFSAQVSAVAIAGLALGGCAASGDLPPVPGADAPPSVLERSTLGADADIPFFLDRLRQCARFASYSYCQAEMYGGGENN